MTTNIKKQCGTVLLFSILIHTQAQDRAQDHNSSRSNKTASNAKLDDWTFGINSGASFAVRSNEGSLFRGNSIATKLYSRYHFGNVGFAFSGGNVPGTINRDALNVFIVERKFQQAQTTKSNPSNSYLLFGPSFRFGSRVMVIADIQGGMFMNNAGSVTIGQAGAVRQLYRFEGAGKNLFPGFSGNISLSYPLNHSTRFVFNTDYLRSKSSVRMYDPQQGIDVPIDQERRVKLFAVGIGITKSFGSNKEAGSGMASGKRHVGNVKYGNRLITPGEATGQRIIAATQVHAINTKGTAATNARMNNKTYGSITQIITNPDGTIEALSFACPDDAATYNDRVKENVTVPRQTQRSTFGEKVNAGLHAAGSSLSQGGSRGVISGNVSWRNNNSSGIITNENVVSSVGALAGGGGAAAASYAATGRMVPSSSTPTGIATAIYTREAGSGMATGKRVGRDNGSGMATGKRKYIPVFNEGETNTCTDCAVSVRLIGHEAAHVVQQGKVQAKDNPLYNENGNQGTNPLFEGKGNLKTGADNDCDGVAGLAVYLIDINGVVVANTKTTACGDFFFANVPSASYVVKLTGGITTTKTYEATINSEGKLDMAGEITSANDRWVIQLNTENNNVQKAGISTSRSNIRTRSINIIETDADGDGIFEPAKTIMEFTDGSSRDVTAFSQTTLTPGSKKVVVRGWDPKKKEEYTISIADSDARTAVTSQQENGTKKEARVVPKISYHPTVIQRVIPVDDANADATDAVIKTKTKSNQSNDRVTGPTNDDNGDPKTYTKTLPSFIGDIDDDGISEILTGNRFASSNVIRQGASLLGGALPGGAVISALAIPGNPIGGIVVKGGRNPGGSFRTTQTNEHGEFEFTGMEKGNYSIIAEVSYYIDDETVVTVGDDQDGTDGATERKGWDGTVKGGSKINAMEDNSASAKKSSAQDHNSSRSNKTASIADNDPGDGTTAKSIVNTTKSNTKDFLVALNDLDQLLNEDKTTATKAIQSVRQKSRLLRTSYQKLENGLQDTSDLETAANEVDTNFAVLLDSVGKLGPRYQSISNVLKTKHDTAKNSVSNIR